MYQATEVALVAASLALRERQNAQLPELSHDKVYRHVIREDDNVYDATMSEALRVPESLVGLSAFSRRLIIPIISPPRHNDILLQPLAPDPDAHKHQRFREQHGVRIQRLGLGWTAIQSLQIISWGHARHELEQIPEMVFNPLKRY